jgi:SecD/SecF fusion protein
MQRNYLRGFLICLLPIAFFGAFAVMGPYRLGIDLAGGTILVYEVDLDKAQRRQRLEAGQDIPLEQRDLDPDPFSRQGLSSEQMQQLAESLKRRIDPADLKNVIIRPVGDSRVEIILPFSPSARGGRQQEAATAEDVQFVKDVVSRVGVLEFRILANNLDDAPAIADAIQRINNLTEEEATRIAKAGQPPPPPEGRYSVTVNDVEEENVTYVWVELSKEERESLGLSHAASQDPQRNFLWRQLAERRGQTFLYESGEEGRQRSMLLFSRDVQDEQFLAREEAEIRRMEQAGQRPPARKQVEYFVLTRVSPVDSVRVGGDVSLTAYPEQDRNLNMAVGFRFNSEGARQFGRMTSRNRPSPQHIRHLAVILDDQVVSAPTLNAVLTDSGIIQGPPGRGLERDYVDRLVYILRSGALTAELKPNPVSENTVGSTLGEETKRSGLMAIAFSFGAVLVFMIFYYRFAGIVACVALLANLILTVGFMVSVNAAFTLAGLAGLVLMLGMAVDANILIYERIREERDKGGTLASAIRNGFERSTPTIFDTHLSSIFTAVVLYTFGNDNLKGFAISLTVGLAISLFTALYMSRLILDFWLHKRWISQLRMLRLFSRPNIQFMKIRGPVFTVTAILTFLGLGLFLYRGERMLNVDFRGGTVFGGRLTEPMRLSGGNGLLDLVADNRQRSLLQVDSVIPFRPEVAEGEIEPETARTRIITENTYQILYTGTKEPVVVTLANPPDGTTEEERLENLRARASRLPDVSIEQVYLADDTDLASGMSRSFTLRTTERERELVQVMLDRLLRVYTDDAPSGRPLLEMATVTVPEQVTGPDVELTFDRPTSVSYVRELLRREFDLAYRTPLAGPPFELTGIPSPDDTPERRDEVTTGRYTRMTLSVSKNPEFQSLRPTAPDAAPPDPKAVEADTKDLATILQRFKTTFESRPLPDRLETFDPTLAADTRTQALFAILVSWLAMMLYLWFRFGNWTFGLAAVLCLLHDLFFTLGMVALSHYLYTLPVFGNILLIQDFKIDLIAVAAFLTLVGYSVNDTIVVFDRIREVRGKNPHLTAEMINTSINQTLSRTVLASVAVFLVVAVLYFFGGPGVHLFSFIMLVGVIIGTYSSIYVASPLLLLFGEGRPATTPTTTPKPAAEVRA